MTTNDVLTQLTSTHPLGTTNIAPEDLDQLRVAAAAVGYPTETIDARTKTATDAIVLLHEARERLRISSQRLMKAIVNGSERELTHCLDDSVPLHREIAAIELVKIRRKLSKSND